MTPYFQKNILENHFVIGLTLALTIFILWELRSTLFSFFIAYTFASALSPAVELLVRKKVHRLLAVTTVFLLTLLLIAILVFPLLPFFTSQTQSFASAFPTLLERTVNFLGLSPESFNLRALIEAEVNAASRNAFLLTSRAFGGFFFLVTTIVITFYLLLFDYPFHHLLVSLFPDSHHSKIEQTISIIKNKLGSWVRGQILLSTTIGLATWLGLAFLGIPFALPLAIIAGFLEVIPTMGPVISAVPAVIVALTLSPQIALATVALYILIQLLENHLLVPKVMEKAVGLNPLAVIIAIMVGGNLLGIAGALLSIPLILVLTTILQQIPDS
ncbi:MAG: hypothetical protein UY21_C0014G0019 [Microgenomates group bacterium GW2011_GWA1_48_10]|nr:MAG: hypothetical protein UY21_C0014G0019 [Microgenomates group bacterium GW2011_GWA1_48_10]